MFWARDDRDENDDKCPVRVHGVKGEKNGVGRYGYARTIYSKEESEEAVSGEKEY